MGRMRAPAFAALPLALSCLTVPVAAQLVEVEPVTVAQSYTLASKTLGGDRIISIRVPAEYAAEPTRRFPVVYLLDGGPDQDFIHIAGIAQSREMNSSFEPFILVGIQSVDRRRMFTPQVENPQPYIEMLMATPGGSAQYRDFLRDELKPLIESKLRTNGEDAVIGESLGGLFIIKTLLVEPGLFDDYISISPSLWWEEMKHAKLAKEYLARAPAGKHRLYLTTANEGNWHREGTERLVAALREAAPEGLEWTFVDAGASETHGTLYHPMALDAFRALYGSPAREYGNHPLVGGSSDLEPTPAEQARIDAPCTRESAIAISPATAERIRDAFEYICVLHQLGPLPREGTLPG